MKVWHKFRGRALNQCCHGSRK